MTEKNKGGRPSPYDADTYPELAYKFCLLGATDEKLAELFDVCTATIYNWRNNHPEFLEAIKKGKEIADAEVAQALYHRAKGYSHPELKVFNNNGAIVTFDTVKHYPPDTGAACMWLKNRQQELWRDKVQHELSGPNETPLFDASRLTEEEREALRGLVATGVKSSSDPE